MAQSAIRSKSRFVVLLLIGPGVIAGPAIGQISAIGDQLIHQDTPGIPGEAEGNDFLGRQVATGDFNGDNLADLAVGIPSESFSGVSNAGSVLVIYATPGGLNPENSETWTQNSAGIIDGAESGDSFGSSLATGDFDNDGYDDLAIGVPTEAIGLNNWPQAGAVQVIYGGGQGLSSVGNQLWHQDVPGVLDDTQPFDLFGEDLTVGDFDNDGYDDLAIGALGNMLNANINVGGVQVLYGSGSGLAVDGNQIWTQASPGISNDAEEGDRFGAAIASGDFDGDGFDDLAIGVPTENLGLVSDVGAVNVIYGSATGLDAAGDQFWNQNSAGIQDSREANDHFGAALAAGDIDNDGYDDLVVGVPEEEIDGQSAAGAINVIYGSSNGLDDPDNQFLHQNSTGMPGVSETNDGFGAALAFGDFNADGFADVVVGVGGGDFYLLPLAEDIGAEVDAGAIHVIHGGPFGFVGVPTQLWHQAVPSVRGAAEADDFFGGSLAAGDLDGDGPDDLVVGIPGEGIGDVNGAGAVQIFYTSGIFEDGFESGDTSAWTGQSP